MDFNAASILTLFIGLVLGGGTIYAIIILTGAGAGKKQRKLLMMLRKKQTKLKEIVCLNLRKNLLNLSKKLIVKLKKKSRDSK